MKKGNMDFFSLQSADATLFYGGFSGQSLTVTAESSPVSFAFQGRKAATSIDRILSSVSLTAGREKEGPIKTRLSIDASRIVPAPKISFGRTGDDGNVTYDTALASPGRLPAATSANCSRCIRACNTFIESFGRISRPVRQGDLQQPVHGHGRAQGQPHDQFLHSVRAVYRGLPQ